MYLLGYSIDNLSLMAITISVGFVVDDAIVVIENVFALSSKAKHLSGGAERRTQIGFTVVSMSTSLVAVFIPLLFMGGLIGRLFHEFAVTLSLADPGFRRHLAHTHADVVLEIFAAGSELRKARLFHRAAESGFNWLLVGYESGLKWVLRHQVSCCWCISTTGVRLCTFTNEVPKGFFPQQDTGVIMGSTEASQDISFPSDGGSAARVAKIVLDDPAVATLGSFIGSGGRQFHCEQWSHVHHLKAVARTQGQRRRCHRSLAKKIRASRMASHYSSTGAGHSRGWTVGKAQFNIRFAIGRSRRAQSLVDRTRQ